MNRQKGDNNFKVDFIGIGAARSATSWITQCLQEHPKICFRKEGANFFARDGRYTKGISYYKELFSHCSKAEIKGELSHGYITSSEAPSRIHKHFPGVKLFVSLRNPIERAYSHYKFAKHSKGPISVYDSFCEAIEEAPSLVEIGKYAKHISRYLDYFSEENLYVILYKDIKTKPLKVIQNTYDFLGVDSDFVPPTIEKKMNVTGENVKKLKVPVLTNLLHRVTNIIKKQNKLYSFLDRTLLREVHAKLISWNRKQAQAKGSDPTSVSDIDPETRKKLQEVYKEDINQLEQLINRDLGHWK